MKRVSFHTLGCKLNYAETASIEKQFIDRGFEVVSFGEESDVCVVNTCSVTERADRECRQLVRRALRTSPESYVVVLGCYAQLQPEEIASIDGVDLVLGAKEKFHLFDHAALFQKSDTPKILVSPISEATDFGPASSGGADDRTRAFLKVQDGCDFNCSFCTIPLARGRSRSQSITESVTQARNLVAHGYREIVLTGVNVGDYGKNDDSSLLELLQQLESIDGLERIRISSIEPNLLTEELLDHWLASEKICDHFHLPLQSGSDEILRLMRRRYTASDYASLIERIRKASPDAGIGADVIVGFPGETDEQFTKSYEFLHRLPVSYLHVFTYSERPHTPSLKLDGRVEPRVRYRRSEMLRILGDQKRRSFQLSQLHSSRLTLFESMVENNLISGYTDNYVRVFVPYHASLENTIALVHLKERVAEGCLGYLENASTFHDRPIASFAAQQAAAL
ncbi:MAG TPA: tRNA (N(6)-L-threonylcarbamoyladenosine(37)-C(2))-methylthiotransferase MtaB [Bacteroidota bacterium]|nr:tRNA (N(6)-L-threonylcarbamoyladenosine(37)-C(2))-methylthiotransferase MtaB [Bacteroidota bacterium]